MTCFIVIRLLMGLTLNSLLCAGLFPFCLLLNCECNTSKIIIWKWHRLLCVEESGQPMT